MPAESSFPPTLRNRHKKRPSPEGEGRIEKG
jgi:hypothetical protein